MYNDKTQIADNIAKIKYEIAETASKYSRSPEDITIMAVTKRVPAETVNSAVDCGIKLLGENRAQELAQKYGEYKLKKDSIHFIGHLQTNKIKSIMDKVTLIQTIDSERLLFAVNDFAEKNGFTIQCLIQVNIALEQTKSGLSAQALEEFLKTAEKAKFVSIKGLMAIPPATDSDVHFGRMQKLFVDIKGKNMDNVSMDILSMGMSGDYLSAIKYGSNIVRLGTAIFGTRI